MRAKVFLFLFCFAQGLLAQESSKELAANVFKLVNQYHKDLNRSDAREVRFLLEDIKSIFTENGMDLGNTSDLACRSNGELFGVFDESRQKPIDRYYSKTDQQCFKSIQGVKENLICIGKNRKFGVLDISTLQPVSKHYSLSFSQCLESVKAVQNHVICLGYEFNNIVRFARYNLLHGTFLDTKYYLSFDKCKSLLR